MADYIHTHPYVAGKLTEVFSKYGKVDHITINIKHSKTLMQSHAERSLAGAGLHLRQSTLDRSKQSSKKKTKRTTAFVSFRGNDGVKNCLALGAPQRRSMYPPNNTCTSKEGRELYQTVHD